MAWPERSVLVLAALVAGCWFIFWMLVSVGLGTPFLPNFDVAVLRWTAESIGIAVAPLWLVLRAVHLAIGWVYGGHEEPGALPAEPIFATRRASAGPVGTIRPGAVRPGIARPRPEPVASLDLTGPIDELTREPRLTPGPGPKVV